MISIPYSYAHPEEVVATNVLGTLNVLQACRTHRVTRLVHTSTSEAYGTARYTPIDEAHALQAQSPYAASKIAADMLVESFQRSYELSAVTLRPFNNYGPRQSARAVIPTIITQALSREKILLGSRDTTRDFLFVADTVEAFLAAGEASVSGEVINVGTGRETSIDEVARLIGTLLGRPLEITLDGARVRPAQSEVRRLVADASKALRLLGWKARVPLEEGLQRTIKWIGESLSLYKVDPTTSSSMPKNAGRSEGRDARRRRWPHEAYSGWQLSRRRGEHIRDPERATTLSVCLRSQEATGPLSATC
jgi:dTDP-glucose 4,6-dehydratase